MFLARIYCAESFGTCRIAGRILVRLEIGEIPVPRFQKLCVKFYNYELATYDVYSHVPSLEVTALGDIN